MSLKFNCTHCKEPIVVEYLKVGDIARCKKCGSEVIVPLEAIYTDEKSSLVFEPSAAISSQEERTSPDQQYARKPYPGFVQAIFLILVLRLGLFLITTPFLIIISVVNHSTVTHPVTSAIVHLIVYGALIYLGFKETKSNINDVFPFKKFQLTMFVPMTMIVIGLQFVIYQLLLRSSPAMPLIMQSIAYDWSILIDRSLWATIFLLIIVAPLTEELLFRGLILRGFIYRYGSTKAIILSTILFAIIHLEPKAVTAAFASGIVFAWWFTKTRSLWPCIFGHILWNLILFIPVFLHSGLPSWVVGGGSLIFIAGFWILHRMFRKTEEPAIQHLP